jgi:hypothetical protein
MKIKESQRVTLIKGKRGDTFMEFQKRLMNKK